MSRRHRHPLGAAAAVAGLALLVSGCTGQAEPPEQTAPPTTPAPPASPAPSPTAEEPEETTAEPLPPVTEVEVVASGLAAPWSIAFHGDTVLMSERDTTRIVALEDDGSVTEVAQITGVDTTGEGGLLGIAVHAEHLYAYYTADGENRVVRYELPAEGEQLDGQAVETIVDGIPAGRQHNGGRLAFGPDGMLYVSTGDAGDSSASQNLDSLGGKILRMTPDGGVPDDNPVDGSLVYSYGHRNVQGLAWSEDGTLYASEFGQDTWDELNIIEAGGNYGWPDVEGVGGVEGFIDPIQQWRPADASPSGIAIVGDQLYIANLRGERLRQVPLSDPETSVERYVGEYGRLRTVVETPGGHLWALTNNTDGWGSPGPDDDRLLNLPLE